MRVEKVSGRVLSGPLEPVYVYEAPVRIWHWVNAVGFIVLILTGFQIRYADLLAAVPFATAVSAPPKATPACTRVYAGSFTVLNGFTA